jgi:hypothetical protein
MVPWCSGLAYVPVKDEIAGSNPVGTAAVNKPRVAALPLYAAAARSLPWGSPRKHVCEYRRPRRIAADRWVRQDGPPPLSIQTVAMPALSH